jgi:hypothetical protein
MAVEMPQWKEFELAVAKFVAAIASDARVTHDVELPDADTGKPRQRDVWVEWSIGGHFPVKALISCKYVNSPLDQLDIDHFNGEFLSANAHVGIIYARKGFNTNAIEKARVLGFHCCRLFRNEPAELPELLIGEIYHFHPATQISMRGDDAECTFTHWKEVFALPLNASTVLKWLADEHDYFQRFVNLKDSWKKAREGRVGRITVERSGFKPVDLSIRSFYRIYRAKVDYMMLNGSYNFSHGEFQGAQICPPIDSQSAHPGPGWELIQTIPERVPPKCIMSFASGDSMTHLQDYGEQPLPASTPCVDSLG